jgi:hypothetical protein
MNDLSSMVLFLVLHLSFFQRKCMFVFFFLILVFMFFIAYFFP